MAITEDWIRQRVQIKHDNLDNVRLLSLPGTYHEKISHFGDSLKHFTRLKSLDVSRNAVESLSGLENLKLLEKLNLYYNNVPSLAELRRIRVNVKLQELDLRLNPVARNEPDYRLFLIHMLPNLRKLDDRAVRDLERKAALMHFSSDEATRLVDRPVLSPPTADEPKTTTNPRVEHVKSLAKMPFYEDDEAVLSHVERTQGNLSEKVITGSSAKGQMSEDYPPDVVRRMNNAYLVNDTGDLPTSMKSLYADFRSSQPPSAKDGTSSTLKAKFLSAQSGTTLSDADAENLQKKYPNLYPMFMSSNPGENGGGGESYQNKAKLDVSSSCSSVRCSNETESSSSYASYKAVGYFTPNPNEVSPDANHGVVPAPSFHPTTSSFVPNFAASENLGHAVEMYEPDECDSHASCPVETDVTLPSSYFAGEPPTNRTSTSNAKQSTGTALPDPLHETFICRISELADKYWNGSKSLLNNDKFRNFVMELIHSIRQDARSFPCVEENGGGGGRKRGGGRDEDEPILSSSSASVSLQRQLDATRGELNRARDENMRLHEKLVAATVNSGSIYDANLHSDETNLKSSLIRAQRDLGIVRGHLQRVTEENKRLLTRIADLEQTAGSGAIAGSSLDDVIELERLSLDNDKLKLEIQTLNTRLKQLSQMQELATMLQDSHKSLVQTNEHLIRELNETRRRHDDEVRQLQRNCDQLRRSAGGGNMPLNGSN